MASDKLQKILAMSKNMDKKTSKVNQAPMRPMKQAMSLNEQISSADKAISNIDQMYNAPYIPTKEEKEKWNTEKGRAELTEMADNNVFMQKLNQSKLPKAIVESMRQNPCNLDPTIVNQVMGKENEFFKKLNEAYAKEKEAPVSGVQAAMRITEQLETRDKQQNIEDETPSNEDNKISTLDTETLEAVISRVIDKKLANLSNIGGAALKTMSLTQNGTFRFLDSEDNVYECQLKFIGKRKKKK